MVFCANFYKFLTLYYSLIYSHIVYCIQAWGNARETELNHILILQKRSVRIIAGNQIMCNSPGIMQSSDTIFFLKLNILKIKDIYLLQISKFIFNCINNNIIINFQNWFKLNCHVHEYRKRSNYIDINTLSHSNNLLILSACTIFYGLKLIKVYRPKHWNTIPNHIRSIVSFKYFFKHADTVFTAKVFLILLKHILYSCYHLI